MPPTNQNPVTPVPPSAPLTPQPVMYDTPGAPQGASPLPPNMGNEPGKRGGMIKWIILVVVVLALAGGLILLLHRSKKSGASTSTSSHQTAESSQLSLLSSKANGLTQSTLSSFNPTDLFFAVYRNAAEQPVATSLINFYQTANLNDQPLPGKVALHQTGFDYRSKQLAYEDSTVYSGTGDSEFDRCSNGSLYFYASLFPEDGWKQQTGPAANDDCLPSDNLYINDQLNTGGLTAAQAQKFVDALRGFQGLITVNKLSLAPVQGKTYLRFDVTIHQLNDGSTSGGVLFFAKAFGATGLDSTKWPYNLGAALVSGVHMAYFVDPSTQLPAYSQIAYTPSTSSAPWDNDQVLYSFGSLPTVTLSTSNIQPLSMPWPIATLQ